jgi:hypothetical protein
MHQTVAAKAPIINHRKIESRFCLLMVVVKKKTGNINSGKYNLIMKAVRAVLLAKSTLINAIQNNAVKI